MICFPLSNVTFAKPFSMYLQVRGKLSSLCKLLSTNITLEWLLFFIITISNTFRAFCRLKIHGHPICILTIGLFCCKTLNFTPIFKFKKLAFTDLSDETNHMSKFYHN